jgi:pimeloyl-ACP methyl ester carboxylesterase
MKPRVTFLMFCLCLAACAHPRSPVLGDWRGAVSTPAGELGLVVRLTEQGGVLESPDQPGTPPTPLTLTEAGPARLAFDAPSISGSFAGAWNGEQQSWTGVWTQSGYQLPLVLRRPVREPSLGLDGVWEGGVEREGRTFRLVLRVSSTPDGTRAKFDAPDAGALNLGVADLVREGARVRFRVPATGARFEGALAGEKLEGSWFFPGRPTTRVELRRTGPAASGPSAAPSQGGRTAARDEEVRVPNPSAEGVTLAGTLSLPAEPGPHAAVVLVSGSGAQNRDEAMFGHRPFAVLAEHLSARGIAVLRLDDRGMGTSTGSFGEATTEDFASDARAAVDWLGARPEIDPARLGLIGHSEGGLVAALAAGGNPRVRFVVLLAAPAVPIEQVLLAQRRDIGVLQGVPEAQLLVSEPLLARAFRAAEAAASDSQGAVDVASALTPDVLEALGIQEAERPFFVQLLAGRWMRHFLRLDPAALLSRLEVPVLAVAGTLDRQVACVPNLAAIRAALGGSHELTVLELPGLNHLLQEAKTGAPAEYATLGEAPAPAALAVISSWLAAR